MIRPATLHDIDAICALCVRCQPDPLSLSQMKKTLTDLIHAEDANVLVAELCGLVAGVVAFNVILQLDKSNHLGRISTIMVDEHFRDMTLGRQLLSAAETYLLARGCDQIEVVPSYHKADAQSFYLHCGFQLTPERLIKALAA
ncbi:MULTISPECIES: GNAT family N-acetyltransferase [Salinivibrio]|uniref:GNAT family N-acetyltransferase n=1 Tax=Salinivibrio costicola subsp. alcaliphilus TaxID=272773 RepID=A0ABX3KSX9_SALCS|nr:MULTISPECIES: GNAT family N-acetyltransferase [Salinivibrio]OOE91415.1 GNAT family N-acetyltransferase [Salinivibrio sp. AR647]OOE91566.1 GNAT family N-acetyltransferase [Salinivibrio sp. AR640]OOF03622.1 GNAT family N-acetyltransferase [Salinivibrio sp. MA607]OOF34077.1 GNAT family N-acetyltransferase [Salinivibrio costicola subsp. alcaliphilus]